MTDTSDDATAEHSLPPDRSGTVGFGAGESAAVAQSRAGPGPDAVLVPTRGAPLESGFTIVAGRTSIGRDRYDDIVCDDATVSRHHAELHHDGQGHYILVDTGSLNGIYLNRERTQRGVLAHGDEIWIGKSRFLFYLAEHPRDTDPHP